MWWPFKEGISPEAQIQIDTARASYQNVLQLAPNFGTERTIFRSNSLAERLHYQFRHSPRDIRGFLIAASLDKDDPLEVGIIPQGISPKDNTLWVKNLAKNTTLVMDYGKDNFTPTHIVRKDAKWGEPQTELVQTDPKLFTPHVVSSLYSSIETDLASTRNRWLASLRTERAEYARQIAETIDPHAPRDLGYLLGAIESANSLSILPPYNATELMVVGHNPNQGFSGDNIPTIRIFTTLGVTPDNMASVLKNLGGFPQIDDRRFQSDPLKPQEATFTNTYNYGNQSFAVQVNSYKPETDSRKEVIPMAFRVLKDVPTIEEDFVAFTAGAQDHFYGLKRMTEVPQVLLGTSTVSANTPIFNGPMPHDFPSTVAA